MVAESERQLLHARVEGEQVTRDHAQTVVLSIRREHARVPRLRSQQRMCCISQRTTLYRLLLRASAWPYPAKL
jgi:hypothetical protein